MHMWERKKCCRKRAWVTLPLIVETQDDDDDDSYDDGDDDNSDDDDDDDDGDVEDDDDDNNCARGGNLSRHDHCQLLISLQIWAQDRHLTENALHLSWQNTKIHNVQQIQSTKYNKYKDTKIWTQERPALVLTKQPSPQYQTRGHSSSMSQSTIAKQTLFPHKRKNSQVSRIWPRLPVK